jgi:ketosteroid isomerase-like protein
MRRATILSLVLAMGLSFLAVCSGPTEKEKVKDLIKELARDAEGRDSGRIMDRLTDDYADFEGRDRDATHEMIEEYFARYRGIVINVLRAQVDELTESEATVQADLAFSSGAARVFRKFAQISLDNYRLKVNLRKTGGAWLVAYAEWRPIGPGELLSGPKK